MNCQAVIKTGKNKGSQCKNAAKNGTFCGVHAPKASQVQVQVQVQAPKQLVVKPISSPMTPKHLTYFTEQIKNLLDGYADDYKEATGKDIPAADLQKQVSIVVAASQNDKDFIDVYKEDPEVETWENDWFSEQLEHVEKSFYATYSLD